MLKYLARILFPNTKIMADIVRKDPVIFVIGCTGTGKSDLGVAIAKKYNGEIISADSMQIYQGLDIATNKMTTEEMEGVPHHLMSFVDPAAKHRFHVQHFRELGLKAIKEIRSRGRVPVIVGGTTYYVESLLFENNFIQTEKSSSADNSDLDALSNTELHELLKTIDSVSASLNHPNNRARVRRAIEIYRLTGKRKSDHIQEQHGLTGGNDLGGTLRFEESLIIALDASLEVLDQRLDGRVEKMKRLGLQKELTDFYEQHRSSLAEISHGVLQCIGLKEFVPYLDLSDEEKSSKKGEKLFELGCQNVKLHTRQYSRKQRNWVNSRLIRRQDDRKMPSLKKLDTSDKNSFLAEGVRIMDEWMRGKEFREQAVGKAETSLEANATNHCEVCDIIVSGLKNWNDHLAGKKHKGKCKSIANRTASRGTVVLREDSDGANSGNGKIFEISEDNATLTNDVTKAGESDVLVLKRSNADDESPPESTKRTKTD